MNCKNSWLHISQNGDDYDDDNEWTMIGFGFKSDNRFNAWYISSNGKVSTQSIDYKYYMRPVFYLSSTVKISSGNGISTDPYIVAK